MSRARPLLCHLCFCDFHIEDKFLWVHWLFFLFLLSCPAEGRAALCVFQAHPGISPPATMRRPRVERCSLLIIYCVLFLLGFFFFLTTWPLSVHLPVFISFQSHSKNPRRASTGLKAHITTRIVYIDHMALSYGSFPEPFRNLLSYFADRQTNKRRLSHNLLIKKAANLAVVDVGWPVSWVHR